MNKCVIALLSLFLAGAVINAHAEDGTQAVKIPFEFLAGGKALPAGTYTFGGLSTATDSGLIVSGRQGSVLLFATMFDSGTTSNLVQLSFDRVNGQYVLDRVKTSEGSYSLITRREMTRIAQMQEHSGMTASGTN